MIVADTNLLLYLTIDGVQSHEAVRALRKDPVWCAPVLWRSEFVNAISLYVRKGVFSGEQAQAKLTLAETQLRGREFRVPSSQVLQLSIDANHPAYDCELVALARQLQIPLVTGDKKLQAIFPDTIILLSDFVSG